MREWRSATVKRFSYFIRIYNCKLYCTLCQKLNANRGSSHLGRGLAVGLKLSYPRRITRDYKNDYYTTL